MSKTRKPKFVRNPDRVTARQVHPDAYHTSDAYASLDDEIDNGERLEGNQPFENRAYYDRMLDQ